MTDISDWEENHKLIREKLYTGVVADNLDTLGFRNQAMRHDIRPLHPDFIVLGRARTGLWMSVYDIKENPYQNEITLLDALKPGDVSVHSADYELEGGIWGELLSTASRMRGSTGAVCDSMTRDVKQIIKMGFPVFARGIRPTDSKGRTFMAEYDVPISCGGVIVNPGDLVFGDYDGVMVVPSEVEDEVIRKALEKVERENITRKELLEGNLLTDVYRKYKTL